MFNSVFLDRLGLISNILGTIFLALAIGKNLEDAHQSDKKGRKIYLAIVRRPRCLIFGIFLVIMGFLAQFFATYLK